MTQGLLEDVTLSGGYGAVVTTHVAEHVADINVYFAQVAKLLAPGGVHVLITPNALAPAYRLLGRFWTYATPDEHRYIHSAAALARLCERHGLALNEHRTTERHCPILRGLIRETAMSVTRGHRPVPRGSRPTAAGSTGEPRRTQRVWDLLASVEGPLLDRFNRWLAPRGYGDELLVVMLRPNHG
jgi:hypothetical protein